MTTDTIDVCKAMIDGTISSFRSNKGWIDKAIAQVSDEKLHVALDANTNSIAVIMKHVAGNLLSRWTDFLTSDGEKPWRNRDDEFVDTFGSREELIAYWDSGWQRLFDTLFLFPNRLGQDHYHSRRTPFCSTRNSAITGTYLLPRWSDHADCQGSCWGPMDDYHNPPWCVF